MSLRAEDVVSSTDVSALRYKRGQRKGAITKVETYLDLVKNKPLTKINLDDLQAKIVQNDEAFNAYELLQARIETLEGPDEVARQQATIDSHRAAMEATKAALQRKVKVVSLAMEIECLEEEVMESLSSVSFTSSTAQARLRSVESSFKELNRRIRPYLSDPQLKGLWSELVSQKKELNRTADEATTPASPVSPTIMSSGSSTTVDSTPMVNYSHLRVKPPTFSGNPLEWSKFESLFSAIIEDTKLLSDRQKVSLLTEAMVDPQAKAKAEDAATLGTYADVFAALTDSYGRPRVVFPLYMDSIFRDLPPIVYSSAGLMEAKARLSKGYRGLQSCKACTAEHLIGQHAFNMLTAEARRAWTVFNSGCKEPPTYEKVLAFFDKEITNLDGDARPPAVTPKQKSFAQPPLVKLGHNSNKTAKVNAVRATDTSNSSKPSSCPYCKMEGHRVHHCTDFRAADGEARRQFVSSSRLCYNCLASGHRSQDCNSRGRCRECGAKHHSLLHTPRHRKSSPASSTPPAVASVNLNCLDNPHIPTKSLLRTAVVEFSSHRRSRTAALLFDEGAEVSLITSHLARTIGSELKPCNLRVDGIGASPVACKHITKVQVASIHCARTSSSDSSMSSTSDSPMSSTSDSSTSSMSNSSSLHDSSSLRDSSTVSVICYVVEHSLTVNAGIDVEIIRKVMVDSNVTPWADPKFGRPTRIDILLSGKDTNRTYSGSDFYSSGRELRFVQTCFGWTVGGGLPASSQPQSVAISRASVDFKEAPEAIFQQLWEQQEIPAESTISPEDQLVLDHFQDTHVRLSTGQYQVALPRQLPAPELGESRQNAIRRFLSYERSLKRRGKWEEFHKVLFEYPAMHHAEKVPIGDLCKPAWQTFYMPVHGVVKESSLTTRLRAVFDASAHTSSGVSFNEQLMTGPTLHPHLTAVLTRFRVHRIAINGDISKMFRGVVLHPAERDYHRFLLRSEQGELEDWRMCRLTFGVKSSPYIATQVLQQAASEYAQKYPAAARCIFQDFYVDDCLTGASTLSAA